MQTNFLFVKNLSQICNFLSTFTILPLHFHPSTTSFIILLPLSLPPILFHHSILTTTPPHLLLSYSTSTILPQYKMVVKELEWKGNIEVKTKRCKWKWEWNSKSKIVEVNSASGKVELK